MPFVIDLALNNFIGRQAMIHCFTGKKLAAFRTLQITFCMVSHNSLFVAFNEMPHRIFIVIVKMSVAIRAINFNSIEFHPLIMDIFDTKSLASFDLPEFITRFIITVLLSILIILIK